MRRFMVLVGVTLTVLALSLVGSAPAQAVKQDRYFYNAASWINSAKAAGLASFPNVASRCPNGVAVAPVVNGEGWIARGTNSGGAVGSTEIKCLIQYNFYVSSKKPLAVPSDYKTFCAVTVHEYGHLAGINAHSGDPKSIMHSPVLIIPPACGSPAPVRYEYVKPK